MAFQHPDQSGLWQKNKAHAEEYASIYPTRLHALAHSFFSSEYAWVQGRLQRDYHFKAARDEPYTGTPVSTDPACNPFYQDVPVIRDGTFFNELNDDLHLVPGGILPPPDYAACFRTPLNADVDHLAALAVLLKNLHLNPERLSTFAYTDQHRDRLHQKDRVNVAALLVTCLDIVEKRGIGGVFACACTRLACLLPELNRLQDKYCERATERHQQHQAFDAMIRNLSPADIARLQARLKGEWQP